MTGQDSPAGLDGRSVLIVEDQVLIALDMEDMMIGLGAGACWLVGSVAEALNLLSRHLPQFALLDFNLGGGETAEAIADRLIEGDVPFVFITGYGERLVVPDRFRNIPVASKPATKSTIAAKIHQALERSS